MADLAAILTQAAWVKRARELFGDDQLTWRFICPICKHVATVADWKNAGAPEGAVAFSCVGRWLPDARKAFGKDTGPGPCDYTGGGLFRLNPVTVVLPGDRTMQVFDFAPPADKADSHDRGGGGR